MVPLKSAVCKFHVRLQELVWQYEIFVSKIKLVTCPIVLKWDLPIRLITGFVQVPHVDPDLLTLSEHLRTPKNIWGIRVAKSLVFYVLFCILLFVLRICILIVAMILSVYFRLTKYVFEYPFCIALF